MSEIITKSGKKLVSFKNLELINNVIKDHSAVYDLSDSVIIERLVIDGLFPKKQELRFISQNYIYGECESIERALIETFNYFATRQALHEMDKNNLLELLALVKLESVTFNKFIKNDINKIEKIKALFKQIIDEYTEPDKKEYADIIYSQLTNEMPISVINDICTFIEYNWNTLSDNKKTFNIISIIISVVNWRNDSDIKVRLLEILRKFT